MKEYLGRTYLVIYVKHYLNKVVLIWLFKKKCYLFQKLILDNSHEEKLSK